MNFNCQFINDLLPSGNRSEGELLDFNGKLKTVFLRIKLHNKFSQNNMNFSETTAYNKKEQNKLLTTLN